MVLGGLVALSLLVCFQWMWQTDVEIKEGHDKRTKEMLPDRTSPQQNGSASGAEAMQPLAVAARTVPPPLAAAPPLAPAPPFSQFPLTPEDLARLQGTWVSSERSKPRDVARGRDRSVSYPFMTGDGFRGMCKHRCEDDALPDKCNFKGAEVEAGDCIYVACFNFERMQVTTEYLAAYRRVSGRIRSPHVVISHNGDLSAPDGDGWHKDAAGQQLPSMPEPEQYSDLLALPSLTAWFASNCHWLGGGPKPEKLYCLPVGVENRYNAVGRSPAEYFQWMQRRSTVRPTKLLFAGFRAAANKPLRDAAVQALQALEALDGSWVTKVEHSVEQPGPLSRRYDFVRALQEHHFAACPPGHGYDTHRLWETLMMGVFPVVISGPMDEMYRELPVVVVKAWTEVTRDFLERTLVQLHGRRSWRADKMFHLFWQDLISNVSRGGAQAARDG